MIPSGIQQHHSRAFFSSFPVHLGVASPIGNRLPLDSPESVSSVAHSSNTTLASFCSTDTYQHGLGV